MFLSCGSIFTWSFQRSKSAFSRRRKSFNSAQSRRWTDSVINPATAFAHDVDVLATSGSDNLFDSGSSLRSSVNFVSLADSQADELPRPFASERFQNSEESDNGSERLTRRKTSLYSNTASSSPLSTGSFMDSIPSCTQHHKKEYGCYTYLRNYS